MGTSEGAPLVLVVEDHDDAREMYCAWLRLAGCRVEEAADGRAAVEKAGALAPALIIMDLSLPVMGGRAAIAALKADRRTRDIPVVAMSGDPSAGALDPAVAGWAAFVSKPCMQSGLVGAVQRVLAACGRP